MRTRIVFCLSLLVWTVCGITILSAVSAFHVNAKVFIAPKHTLIVTQNEKSEVRAGKAVQIPVDTIAPAEIRVSVRVHNRIYDDLNVWVCSDAGYQSLLSGRANDCRGVNRGKANIKTSYAVHQPGGYRVVLDNGFSAVLTKKVSVSIGTVFALSDASRQRLKLSFEKSFHKIQSYFNVPEFNFALRPCGDLNAMSMRGTGDIVFCSELFFGLHRRGLKGAVEAILWHELGHSLLDLMGLPNSSNEETADEFAIVMLLWEGRQEKALDWIKYYGGRNAAAEAQHIIHKGDRHPLSIQRIRNIERILSRPSEIVSAWNNLLYSKLSAAALRKIIDNPGRFHEREKAQKELASR